MIESIRANTPQNTQSIIILGPDNLEGHIMEPRSQYVQHQIENILQYAFALFIQNIIFCCVVCWTRAELALAISLSTWILLYFWRMLRLIFKRNQVLEQRRYLISLSIIRNFLMGLFTALLSVKFSCYPSLNAHMLSLLLLLEIILGFCCISNSTNICFSIMCFSRTVASFVRALTVCMVFLKYERVIADSWCTTFWPLWMLHVILFLISFYSSIVVCSFFPSPVLLQEGLSRHNYLGGLWILYVLMGFPAVFLYTQAKLVFFLDGKRGGMVEIALPGILYLFIGLVTYKIIAYQVILFIEKMLFGGNAINELKKNQRSTLEKIVFNPPLLFERKGPGLFEKRITETDPELKSENRQSTIRHFRCLTEVKAEYPQSSLAISVIADPPSMIGIGSSRGIFSTINEQPSMIKECSICCSNFPDGVLGSCGHGGICYDCGVTIMTKNMLCPFCRSRVTAIYRIEKTYKKTVLQASDVTTYVNSDNNKDQIIEILRTDKQFLVF